MADNLTITDIRNEQDMAKIDADKIAPKQLPSSTYHAIKLSAERYGNKAAIKYVLDGSCLGPDNIPLKKHLIHQAVKLVKGESFAQPYREISFIELADQVTRAANALHQLGVQQDDTVSIVMPNFPEMYVSLWGAETAGIANPINPMLETNVLKEIMRTAGTKILIALGPVPGSDIWQKVVSIKDEIPGLTAVISLFGKDNKQSGKVPVYSFHQLLALQSSKSFNGQLPEQNSIASYFHTGGTTGLPKLAKHSQLNELTNAAQVNLISPVTSEDTVLVGLPIFHVNAAIATGLAAVMEGTTTLLAGPAGYRTNNIMNDIFDMIEHFNVGFLTGVPTVYAALVESLDSNPHYKNKLCSMKLAICGAAPLSQELGKKFEQLSGVPLIEGYGLTETSAVATLMPTKPLILEQAVGLTIPSMTIKIANIDEDGQLISFCETGEAGEILVHGNNVFPGYLDDSHNEQLWIQDQDGKRYVRTGDLGRFDQHGYLSLAGRKKELIIRGGHNIDPKSIEDVAAGHKDVLLAAAVGRPDKYAGEVPVLYVTLVQGSQLTEAELSLYMAENISERAANPKATIILDEMPTTAVGKLFKPALVCKEIDHIITHHLAKIDLADNIDIASQPDKKLGISTVITIKSELILEQVSLAIDNELDTYAFHYTIEQAKPLAEVS